MDAYSVQDQPTVPDVTSITTGTRRMEAAGVCRGTIQPELALGYWQHGVMAISLAVLLPLGRVPARPAMQLTTGFCQIIIVFARQDSIKVEQALGHLQYMRNGRLFRVFQCFCLQDIHLVVGLFQHLQDLLGTGLVDQLYAVWQWLLGDARGDVRLLMAGGHTRGRPVGVKTCWPVSSLPIIYLSAE